MAHAFEKADNFFKLCRDCDPMIVSTFVLPRLVAFPLKFKINFDQGVGVFSINKEQLIGSYDFNAFTGEALLRP